MNFHGGKYPSNGAGFGTSSPKNLPPESISIHSGSYRPISSQVEARIASRFLIYG